MLCGIVISCTERSGFLSYQVVAVGSSARSSVYLGSAGVGKSRVSLLQPLDKHKCMQTPNSFQKAFMVPLPEKGQPQGTNLRWFTTRCTLYNYLEGQAVNASACPLPETHALYATGLCAARSKCQTPRLEFEVNPLLPG